VPVAGARCTTLFFAFVKATESTKGYSGSDGSGGKRMNRQRGKFNLQISQHDAAFAEIWQPHASNRRKRKAGLRLMVSALLAGSSQTRPMSPLCRELQGIAQSVTLCVVV